MTKEELKALIKTLKIEIAKLQDTLDKKNKTLEHYGIQYKEK